MSAGAGRARRWVLGVILAAVLIRPPWAAAAAESNRAIPRETTLAGLGARGPWRLRRLRVTGVGLFDALRLRGLLATRPRPLWAFWRDLPPLIPAELKADLERLRREMEGKGYYGSEIEARLRVLKEPSGEGESRRPGVVEVEVRVDPGTPVRVCALEIDLGPSSLPAAEAGRVLAELPLRPGDVFERSEYQDEAALLAASFTRRGHPRASVERSARVDVPERCARAAYRVAPGEEAVFGKTRIEGLERVEEDVVRRELAYRPGELFDARKVAATERRLRDLHLFSSVRLSAEPPRSGVAPMRLLLAEGPRYEVRLGAGYSTEDGVRGLASWWSYDFLGGARQLGFSARISQVTRQINASFVQPHFPRIGDRARLDLTVGQEDESTFFDDFALLAPRLEWGLAPGLRATAFLTFQFDSLSKVSPETKRDLGVFQSSGFTNSFGLGLRWVAVDDPRSPRRGFAVGLSPEIGGGPLGGDFDQFRLAGDVRGYLPLGPGWRLAARARGGSVVPYGRSEQVPLWARYYAGGTSIFPVRGYRRRRVGPLSGSNDPLGGRTATVASLELRRRIAGPVWGVAFVDTGDVERSAWTIDPDGFQTGVGLGIRLATPVGPVQADVGFGLNRRGGDGLVQLAFSIGPEL